MFRDMSVTRFFRPYMSVGFQHWTIFAIFSFALIPRSSVSLLGSCFVKFFLIFIVGSGSYQMVSEIFWSFEAGDQIASEYFFCVFFSRTSHINICERKEFAQNLWLPCRTQTLNASKLE